MSLFFIIYNVVNIPQDRPLADKRVRLALNYAVDRQALITALMHNVGVPVSTFCTEVSPGCDKSIIPPFTYDPQRARDLLREAGYPNGFPMTIGTTSGAYPGDRDLTMAVAGQLNNVGIKAQVIVTEYGVAINQLVNKTAPTDAVFVRYTDFVGYAGGIAMRAFNPKGGVTLYVPGNPELQPLLDTAEQTLDESTRRDLYRRAHLLFREEAPAIPLMTAPNVHGTHRDLDWIPRPDLLLKAFDASWKQR
jgi:peptide/nickel transport system substrate-binding protein